MNVEKQGIIKGFRALLLVSLVAVGGCSTDSGARDSAAGVAPEEGSEYVSSADVRKDPDRVICKRHKPTGSRISEKICMTARQWQAATDDTHRVLDKAQRQTGGTQSN